MAETSGRAEPLREGDIWVKISFASAFLRVLALLSGLAVASLWRDRHNVLANYPEFHSTKTDLSLGVMGAMSFLETPVSLPNGKLNLAAWHGHQELWLNRNWSEQPEVSLRLRAGAGSEMELEFSSGGTVQALRLSNLPARPSAWLKVGAGGNFLSKTPVAYVLPHEQWVQLRISPGANGLTASVEGEKLPLPPISVVAPVRVGLRGASRTGRVLVGQLRLAAGGQSYEQDFNGDMPWLIFLLASVAASLLFFVVERRSGARAAAILGGAGFLGLCGLLALYRGSLAYRYPLEVNLMGKPSHITWTSPATTLPPGEKPLLLWLGGSQAWGAGASVAEKSAFGLLRAKFEASSKLEWVNGAVSGATLADQSAVFDQVRARRKVAAVVLISGVNDAENSLFQDRLGKFAKIVRESGARFLLVPEPSEPEPATRIASRQADVVAVGKRDGIPVADLQPAFTKHDDDGFLWWDFVHLTDAGARFEAEQLEDFIRPLFP